MPRKTILKKKDTSNDFANIVLKKNILACFKNPAFLEIYNTYKPLSASKFTYYVYKYLLAYVFIHSAVWKPVKIDFIHLFLDDEFERLKSEANVPQSDIFEPDPRRIAFIKEQEVEASLLRLVEKSTISWNRHAHTFSLHPNILEEIKTHLNKPKEVREIKTTNITNNENSTQSDTLNSSETPNSSKTKKRLLTTEEGDTLEKDEYKANKKVSFQFASEKKPSNCPNPDEDAPACTTPYVIDLS